MVGGKDKDGDTAADQLILAPDPKDGQLGEVSEGSWIYYIEPKDQNDMVERPEKVQAELYRVQNGETNEGDRLVSDTHLWRFRQFRILFRPSSWKTVKHQTTENKIEKYEEEINFRLSGHYLPLLLVLIPPVLTRAESNLITWEKKSKNVVSMYLELQEKGSVRGN